MARVSNGSGSCSTTSLPNGLSTSVPYVGTVRLGTVVRGPADESEAQAGSASGTWYQGPE